MERDPVTMSDFLAWREQSITKAYFADIIERIEGMVGDIVVNAGIDQLKDRWKAGKVSGLTELADWKPEIKRETTDEL